MADKMISELNPATGLAGDELMPISQGGLTRQATLTQLAELAPAGPPGPAGGQGPPGADGANGDSVLSGPAAPTPDVGNDGEFYLDYNTARLYGPKTSGDWGSGVSLIGPNGSEGPQGPAGVSQGQYEYKWKSVTTATDPIHGYVKGNTLDPTTFTFLYISAYNSTEQAVVDINRLKAGDEIFLYEFGQFDSWNRYSITGNPINHENEWFELPVSYAATGSLPFAPPNNTRVNIMLPVTGQPGPAGPAGTTGAKGDAGPQGASSNSGIFGDGSLGNVTISTNTTITTDKYYDTLTVNPSVTLTIQGSRVLCKTALVNNGTISTRGNDAAAGVAGTALASGTLGPNAMGTAGGAGGANAIGANGTNVTLAPTEVTGGAGGGGGTSGTNAGGTASLTNQVGYGFRSVPGSIQGAGFTAGLAIAGLRGGSGGGGGGGSAASTGGGGGGGGGCMILAAKTITNAGTITVAGGNGGNGTGTAAGGGGGGGGGILLLTYNTITNTGTITAAGGQPGTGIGTGVSGNPGIQGSVVQVANI